MDLLFTLLRVAVGAPLITAGLAWWAVARSARRWVPSATGILAPLVLVTWLWRNRRHLRGAIVAACAGVVAVVWIAALGSSAKLRWAFGLAAPAGTLAYVLAWNATTYPALPPWTAIRYHMRVARHREVLSDAVHASAGDGARVVAGSVKALPDGSVECEVIGPAGMPHDDLLTALRGSLAESVLAVSGRTFRSAAVVGAGAKGRVRVRCSTHDPLSNVVGLDEL